jgi:alpha-galactosidase
MKAFPPRDQALADLTLRFPYCPASGRIGLQIFPTALADRIVPRRAGLAGLPYIDAIPGAGNPPAIVIDPIVQLKRMGDPYAGGFSQGHTLRNSASLDAFRYADQRLHREAQRTVIITLLESDSGCRLEHRLSWYDGDAAVESVTSFCNGSDAAVTLEMLSSFALGGITPFDGADAPGRLRVHRFRSVWSAEARLETRSIEELHLERSWSGSGAFSERFGQAGTMPVRRWFPFVAVEDTRAGVCWGAQLAWAGSWQMEIYRQHDDVCLSGGLADREFGHWTKTLQPGESLVTPAATLSCVQGTLDALCDRLTAVQQRALDGQPEVEQDLPIVFNEYCTTWGQPEHSRIIAIADRLQDLQTRYLVIDAGWYKQEGVNWSQGHGDWIPSEKLFPGGLEATAAAIRDRGQIPGLWYEMETVGSHSTAFSLADHLLQRDGQPVTVGERRFWDLNDPWVVEYLAGAVIDLLERCGFGYLKVDYNETLGLGSTHPDGLGEGLRQQVLGSYRFFELIRARLPHLVIENCASGGHRLEPSMLARTAMSSFSDAHELVEIPIIAANLHRLLLPRQSQIWAVLHQADSDQRLIYSLAATFLGRMCLSGEIEQLTRPQLDLVKQALAFYRLMAPIIKHGTSRLSGRRGESWRHPTGWQAMTRTGIDAARLGIVIHTFAEAPAEIEVPLPAAGWRVERTFPEDLPIVLEQGRIHWTRPGEFHAGALLLTGAV